MDDETSYLPDTAALAARNPDRSPNGWLKKGNALSRGNGGGNPEAKAQYEARKLWRDAATEEEQLKVRAALVEQALDGNLGAIRLYVDVMHGKQVQPIELSGPDGESIRAEQTNVVAVILGALAAFPEARIKVAAALAGRPVEVEDSSDESGD